MGPSPFAKTYRDGRLTKAEALAEADARIAEAVATARANHAHNMAALRAYAVLPLHTRRVVCMSLPIVSARSVRSLIERRRAIAANNHCLWF